MRRYPRMKDGQWIAPKRRGYRLACCDCGLVHELEFRLMPHGGGKRIIFRAYRHRRATASMRAWELRRAQK